MAAQPPEPDPETPNRCPACGEDIPPADLTRHLAGRDGLRPGCPRQDLTKIKKGQESPSWAAVQRGRVW